MEKSWLRLKKIIKNNQEFICYQSTCDLDPIWDNFLEETNYAHFEQTSTWARSKKNLGWSCSRIIVETSGQIVGGFQILQKRILRFFNAGLLMQGPVLKEKDPALASLMINFLQEYAHKKLTVILVQPPAEYPELFQMLIDRGFLENSISFVIKSATVVINLNLPEEVLLKNMKRQKKQNIRSALAAGVNVIEGKREDLPIFFNLMIMTCKRRGVVPNPPSAKILEDLWDSLSGRKKIRLFLTEFQGEIISGILVIFSGNRAYLWKFGWSGKFSNYHPNELLFWEIFKRVKEAGYQEADLGYITSYKREKGKFTDGVSSWEDRSDAVFKIGLGGQIKRLLPAAIYFPLPVFRWTYKYLIPVFDSIPITRKKLVRLIG